MPLCMSSARSRLTWRQGDAQVHCCTLVRCKLILVDVKTAEFVGPLRKELDAKGAGPVSGVPRAKRASKLMPDLLLGERQSPSP